jgi:hypothetical protein
MGFVVNISGDLKDETNKEFRKAYGRKKKL